MTAQVTTVEATVVIPEVSLERMRKAVNDRRAIRETEIALQEAVSSITTALAAAVQTAKDTVGKAADADGILISDYCSYIGAINQSASIESALQELLGYGFFDGDNYDFSHEDDDPIVVKIQSDELPRLAIINAVDLTAFDPATGKMKVRSLLHYDDIRWGDPEKWVQFSLDPSAGSEQHVSVLVTDFVE